MMAIKRTKPFPTIYHYMARNSLIGFALIATALGIGLTKNQKILASSTYVLYNFNPILAAVCYAQ